MAHVQLDADYLVLGAGAMGMAFCDSILTHDTSKTIILVDQHGQPGGHWNDAYPYVRLHQPSAFYGVDSQRLEQSDNFGELASRNEVLAYYEKILAKFIATGRVRFFPMCRFEDATSRSFHSLVDFGRRFTVSSKAKVVDATYMKVVVPAISNPQDAGRYTVANDAEVVPLNSLPSIGAAREKYVIIGSGKSGMDAVVWLLENFVSPDRVVWVMPRDAWVLNRDVLINAKSLEGLDMAKTLEVNKATDVEDYFRRCEEAGVWMRIDPTVQPTRNKCATVSEKELHLLRSVKNVLRLGRLSRVDREQLIFQRGDVVSVGPNAVYVDCSSDGLVPRPKVPVFDGDRITLQSVSLCQQVFSAALIGFLETRADFDEATKRKFSVPVPHPDTSEDLVIGTLQTMRNMALWASDTAVSRWLNKSRLHAKNHTPPLSTLVPFMLRNITLVPAMMKADKAELECFERVVSKL
jgi:hypothetical protein